MTVTLNSAAERFLEYKKALGRKYHSEQRELRLLVRFAEQRSIQRLDGLSAGLLEDFLASRPRLRPRSFKTSATRSRSVVCCAGIGKA